MRSIVLKSGAVVSVSLLVVSMLPATASADSPAVTYGVWAILPMILGSLLLVGTVAASVDAADGVPAQSVAGLVPASSQIPALAGSESLAPVGSVEIPQAPGGGQGLIPEGSLGQQNAPQPAAPQRDVAPAPGPQTANGRG